jgi:hypothetical protein
MPNSNKNYNFYRSALYNRVLALVDGNTTRVDTWWDTPLPYAPFNLRAPSELMDETNYKLVEDWLVANSHGADTEDPYKYKDFRRIQNKATDVNYANQSMNQVMNTNAGLNYLKYNSTVTANGGTTTFYIPSSLNNRIVNNWTNKAISTSEAAWKVHTFTSSGDFTVFTGGYIEYLIVGGGGGGGGGYSSSYPVHPNSRTDSAGGGGGGGGVLYGSLYLPSGNYAIVIGDGGVGGYDNINFSPFRQSTDGGNSSAFGLIAYGGGAGASGVYTSLNYIFNGINSVTQGAGQSAGAHGYTNSAKATGGGGGYAVAAGADGMGGQGFSGGTWVNGSAGGGGGAGSVGANGTNERGGNGGSGVVSSINGTDTYYGGGGGGGVANTSTIYSIPSLAGGTFGGAGGLGGGGTAFDYVRAANASTAQNGTNGLGGGGAGATAGYTSGNGGSGIVIIRYHLQKPLP